MDKNLYIHASVGTPLRAFHDIMDKWDEKETTVIATSSQTRCEMWGESIDNERQTIITTYQGLRDVLNKVRNIDIMVYDNCERIDEGMRRVLQMRRDTKHQLFITRSKNANAKMTANKIVPFIKEIRI